jgi:hypothetical protein
MRDVGLDPLLERWPLLVERRDLRLRERLVRDIRKRRTPP